MSSPLVSPTLALKLSYIQSSFKVRGYSCLALKSKSVDHVMDYVASSIKMKSRNDIIAILSRLKSSLGPRYKIKKMGLFGSYARGDQTDKSDIDVLVDIDPAIGLNFVTLAESIEKELGISTDVVSLRAIKPRYLSAIGPEIIYV